MSRIISVAPQCFRFSVLSCRKLIANSWKTNSPNIRCLRTDAHLRSSNGTKLSYFHNPGDGPFLSATVGELVDKGAELYGDKEAVVVSEANLRKTFAELKKDVDNFAAGLLALGLKQKDRIGIWSPNNYEWVVTQFAAAKAGLILVNINPAYQPRELEYCLNKVGVRAIIAAETYKTQNYYKILETLIPAISNSTAGEIQAKKIKKLSHVIMISNQEYGGSFKFSDVSNAANSSHFKQLEELKKIIQFDEPNNIQFTSGTTGYPKGAILTHFNIVNNAYLIGKGLGYHEKTHHLCLPVPLYHCLGCVLGSLAALIFGGCSVYPAPVFNAEATAIAIEKEKCTAIYGTPTMFIDILNLENFKKYDFSSLTTGLMTGSGCPEEIVKESVNSMRIKELTVCYGCTETSPVITQCRRDAPLQRRATTIGTVIGHTEMKIVDPNTGCIVPCGQPGELLARGFSVMLGYWDDAKKTKDSITEARWYKTGDLAVVDEEGYAKIIGRIKDMVIRGGENIYPREIEEYLHTHPNIAEVHVVGVPDKRMGEELCAWIKLRAGTKLDDKEVKAFCEGKLAHFKVPRYIKFVSSFPITVTGKIQKFVMRDESAKELGLVKNN